MTFERQRTVNDGEWVVDRDDPAGDEPTKGPLIHGVEPNKTAIPIHTDHQGHVFANDQTVSILLEEILKELKKMNMYNAMTHDNTVSDRDIGVK